ncbi:MAG: redox-sensing transcriptional repressor Rex [Anaerolineae bacterium]|nr:redox-sensing transcriptional repressor Rex [Anaerolineae bacterium]
MPPKNKVEVPDIVVSRLPLYLRALNFLAEEGVETISSAELAQRLGISSAQIRKDLSFFGEFGKQGTGYNVEFLRKKIKEILNLTKIWDVALVGAGDLGHALVHYGGFLGQGFRISLVFDNNPQKIGQEIAGLVIQPASRMKELIRQHGIQIAIIAVPASAAQKVTDELVAAGVRAILNYAPITLKVPPGVHVQYIDPVTRLQHMTYYLE